MEEMNYTIEELLERVEELELLTNQLLEDQKEEAKSAYEWSGNLGKWYWNIKANSYVYNSLKIVALGYSPKDFSNNVTYQFFTDKIHPEDKDRVLACMNDFLDKKSDKYEIEYRIRTKKGTYKWFFDQAINVKYGSDKKPLLISGTVFDITKEKEMKETLDVTATVLSKLSRVDDLTNILNHRGIMDGLKHEIDKSKVTKTPLSIALIDIDDFQELNDNNGHIYGDYILKEIASIMSTSLRDDDFIGRYGGDEFLIVFSDSDIESSKTVTDRIKKRVEEYSFNDGIKLTISGGVCEYIKDEDMFVLINKADKKLKKAKKSGKNSIE